MSIVYNNGQGFINIKDLKLNSPPLNKTKVHEMKEYIFDKKPDIIFLNETWLKKTNKHKQAIPENYEVEFLSNLLFKLPPAFKPPSAS